jgi:Zn-finger nucleic acid-binding protein
VDKGNTQNMIPNTQESDNTQKMTSATQKSVSNAEFLLSEACKGVITTTAEFDAIFDSSGIGKSQNRSDVSINSENADKEIERKKEAKTKME